jgi:hypothetical protein
MAEPPTFVTLTLHANVKQNPLANGATSSESGKVPL